MKLINNVPLHSTMIYNKRDNENGKKFYMMTNNGLMDNREPGKSETA